MCIRDRKYPEEHLAAIYNMADCTINISDAEGFGLATLESLSCGTPIIANMTGGLQEQITDGTNEFGIPVYPVSKCIIGSQEVPYIYEDRITQDDFEKTLSFLAPQFLDKHMRLSAFYIVLPHQRFYPDQVASLIASRPFLKHVLNPLMSFTLMLQRTWLKLLKRRK